MKTAKRTKIEYTQKALRNGLKTATIREIYVDSGRVKRIRCELSALEWPELRAQIQGAMAAIEAERNNGHE